MSDTPKTYDFNALSHAFGLFAASPAARDRGNEGNLTRMLAKALYSHADMSELPKAIETLQRAAKTHGVPEELVANASSYNDDENLFLICSSLSSYSKEKTQICADAGINPWLVARREYKNNNINNGYAVDILAPAKMAQRILGGDDGAVCATRGASLIMASTALAQAGSFGAEHSAAFAKCLFECFETLSAQSMQGAHGVMGAADKRAKTAAEILIEFATPITQAAGPALAAQAAKTLAKAKALRDAKAKPGAFDPAKYKKNMAPHKKERLISIMTLSERSGDDQGAAALLASATPWIAEEPHALCLPIKSHQAVLISSLARGDVTMIELAEKIGSNIWLASAQTGNSNACEMLINDHAHSISANPSLGIRLARMLALGAHWDGTINPVEHALSMLEASKTNRGYHYDASAPDQAKAALRAGLESISFEQLLKARELDAQEEQEAPPPRRRNSL